VVICVGVSVLDVIVVRTWRDLLARDAKSGMPLLGLPLSNNNLPSTTSYLERYKSWDCPARTHLSQICW
jgi:hypothetical protein